jgi:Ca-activated chloride channel homolog
MKYIKSVMLAATLLAATASPGWPRLAAGQSQKQKPPVATQQQKDKKSVDEDDQVIKLGGQLVTVPFNVTDKTNRYINELAKEEIELLEDNKPQQIFSFERQTDLPLTIALLIDISGSQEYTLPEEVAAGKRFFTRVLRPSKDLGAVVSFEGESELVQDLTSNVDKLTRALDEVRVPVRSAPLGGGGTPPINGGSRSGGTSMYDSIYAVSSDLLRREAGRRVIILITDGVDTTSNLKMRDAIERTWRNEIIVYVIGIGDPAYDGVNHGVLKKISAETGGRAFFPRKEHDLDTAFAQIEEDLRSQYIASYTPANEVRDGSFRTILVRVKNRKDLTVRHRRGYFAPKSL